MSKTMHILPLPRRIALIAFDGVQLLDVTGPASVFAAANDQAGGDAYAISVIAPEGGLVRSSSGIAIAADRYDDVDPAELDTWLVAGGSDEGIAGLLAHPGIRAWAVAAAPLARRYGSICAGAFALAGWGLVEGRRVATHWGSVAELKIRYPGLRVDGQALYVEDGPLWTSAGISTGIDMALAMVERDLGHALAAAVARQLVLYARRPGHQSQFSALLDAQAAPDYAALIDWIAAHLGDRLDVERLAARAGQSVRTFHRRFTASTGKTPAAFVEALRLERARTLIGSGLSLKEVARDCGFTAPEQMTRAFVRLFGVSPSTWRALHA